MIGCAKFGRPAINDPLSTVFYPMHRVERIAQDDPSGEIPSLAQRFSSRIGVTLVEYLRMGK